VRLDYYRTRMQDGRGVIANGYERARKVARATMAEVREAIRI